MVFGAVTKRASRAWATLQERHLVAIVQGRGATGDFLIDRDEERIRNVAQAREARFVTAPKTIEVFSFGEFDLLLRETCQVVREAEKQNVHLHALPVTLDGPENIEAAIQPHIQYTRWCGAGRSKTQVWRSGSDTRRAEASLIQACPGKVLKLD